MHQPRGPRLLLAVLALVALAASVAAAPVAADPNNNNSQKLREAVTLAGVRKHQAALQAIADVSSGNRFAGLPGYERSADYVAEQLTAAGYLPTFWYFTYNAFVEDVTSELRQVSPAPATYVNGIDFRIMSYSGSGTVTGAAGPARERRLRRGRLCGVPRRLDRARQPGHVHVPDQDDQRGHRRRDRDRHLQQHPGAAERDARRGGGARRDPVPGDDAVARPVARGAARHGTGRPERQDADLLARAPDAERARGAAGREQRQRDRRRAPTSTPSTPVPASTTTTRGRRRSSRPRSSWRR